MSKGYERMYQDMYCDFGLKKEKSTRVGLEPTTSGLTSGALSTQLSSPMLVVSLFYQYLCLGCLAEAIQPLTVDMCYVLRHVFNKH